MAKVTTKEEYEKLTAEEKRQLTRDQWYEDMEDFDYRKFIDERKKKYNINLNEGEIEHMIFIFHSLVRSIAGRDNPGSFVHYLSVDDYRNAIINGDMTNIKAFGIYADFIYNHKPVCLIHKYEKAGYWYNP